VWGENRGRNLEERRGTKGQMRKKKKNPGIRGRDLAGNERVLGKKGGLERGGGTGSRFLGRLPSGKLNKKQKKKKVEKRIRKGREKRSKDENGMNKEK